MNFPKCSKQWNKRTQFHIDWARRDARKGTKASCERALAHLDEARRSKDACHTPANLRDHWGNTSREVLSRCRGSKAPLRGARRKRRK